MRPCLGFPGEVGRMLVTSPVLCLFGVDGRRRRRPGLGWEAPDAVPRAGGNRLFGELVTPPCPPPSPLAGSREGCGSGGVPAPSTEARARQAVRRRRRERGGRLGVPARCPLPGRGGWCSLAPSPCAGCSMALAAAKCQIRISSGWGGGNWPLPAEAAALPMAPPGTCLAEGGADTPAALRAPAGTWCVRLPNPSSIALPLPLHPYPAFLSPLPRGYSQRGPGRGAWCYPPSPHDPSSARPGKSQTRTGRPYLPEHGACGGPASEGCRGDWRLPWGERLPAGRWPPCLL